MQDFIYIIFFHRVKKIFFAFSILYIFKKRGEAYNSVIGRGDEQPNLPQNNSLAPLAGFHQKRSKEESSSSPLKGDFPYVDRTKLKFNYGRATLEMLYFLSSTLDINNV